MREAQDTASDEFASVSGGQGNNASNKESWIGGGLQNLLKEKSHRSAAVELTTPRRVAARSSAGLNT
jgi:hypothetical protein